MFVGRMLAFTGIASSLFQIYLYLSNCLSLIFISIQLTALDPEDKSVDLNLDYDTDKVNSDPEDGDVAVGGHGQASSGYDDDFARENRALSPGFSVASSSVPTTTPGIARTMSIPYTNPHSSLSAGATEVNAAMDDFIDDEEEEEDGDEGDDVGDINFDIREEDHNDGSDVKRVSDYCRYFDVLL